MLGIYLAYVDYDDSDGSCKCLDNQGNLATFPATRAAEAGSNNLAFVWCDDFES